VQPRHEFKTPLRSAPTKQSELRTHQFGIGSDLLKGSRNAINC